MTKLEDKLLASVNKPAQAKKTSKETKPAEDSIKTPRVKTKAKAKQKPAQKQVKKPGQANLNSEQSVLHPQRIWPD